MISGVSRTFDELEVGAVYRSRFGRTVLDADNVWFTLLTLNTNPIHFDAEHAASTEWASRSRDRCAREAQAQSRPGQGIVTSAAAVSTSATRS